MLNKLIYFIFALAAITIAACNSGQNGGTITNDDTSTTNQGPALDPSIIAATISSVPNPVEMSMLLQQSGVVYSSDLLNPVENINRYSTELKKALNLGTYGTDLVHMNIYDRTVSTVLYLKNIKDIANDLSLGQFFDYETLNRLSENNKNIDSILFITSDGYNRMNNFLIEQRRSPVAICISFGTWIESLYLASNINKISNKQQVYDRVGGQREVLENIIILLEAFKQRSEINDLLTKAQKLKKAYEKVSITYNYKPPITKEVDGMLVVIDQSEYIININDSIANEIGAAVNEVRNSIIK